jgi:hypothetical protein
MNLRIRPTQDLVSGVALIALSLIILATLSKIPKTSFQAIAPDLFPRLCAYGLVIGGVMLIARGILKGGDGVTLPPARAFLAVLVGVILFGALSPIVGYAPAGLLTLIVSGLGSPLLNLRQLVTFSLGLILFSVVLFSYVLKLSMPILILPGFRL